MVKIAAFRKNKLNEMSHKNIETMKRVEQKQEKIPWEIKLNKSNNPVYVQTLSSKIKREKIDIDLLKKRAPFKIDSTLFIPEANYSFHHMPKIEDVYYKRLNFSFGETRQEQQQNFDDMLNAPKSVVLYYKQESQKNNQQYLTIRAYFVAAKTNNENLTKIYRMDIKTKKENNEFKLDYIKAAAVVGGCVDGECPLFEIGGNETEMRLYTHKSGKTFCDVDFNDDVSNMFYDVRCLDVHDLYQASQFAFEYFNVQDVLINHKYNDTKLSSLIKTLNAPDKGDYTTPISGDKFVGLTIGKEEKFKTENSWQYVYNNNGKLNKTNVPKKAEEPEF